MSKDIFVQRGKSPEIIKLCLDNDDRLITEKNLATILGLKRRTIQQRRYLGKEPGYFKLKDSGAVRYLLSEVYTYLSESSSPE